MSYRIIPAVALLVLVAAAGPAAGGTGVPLNLSGGFNMEFWVSPTMLATCQSAGKVATAQFGLETATPYAYAFDMAGQNIIPVVNATYGGTVVSGGSGVGGFPANGALTSLNADGRSYYLPSLAGNALYPGDQLEATNSNVVIVGQGRTNSGPIPYSVLAVTMSVTPGYYADLNFVLAGGEGYNTVAKTIGAQYVQIWVIYSDTSSIKLYDFSTGPYSGTFYGPCFYANPSNTDSDFRAVYTASYTYYNSGTYGSVGNTHGPLSLYEFVTPRTLNANKILTGLEMVSTAAGQQSSINASELALLAATATAATTSSVTLTTSVGPAGAGTVTPSGGAVPGQSTQSLTASANSGYVFDHWTASDSAAYLANSLSASTTVTLGTNNCTVTGVFRSTSGYSGSETATGGTIQLTSSGPYNYGQVVGITVSVNAGWRFTSWSATGATVWSSTATTTSLTVLNSFTLAALFTEIPYTVTTSAAPLAGGTVSYLPTGTQYINNVLTITALPSPGYQFVSWTVSGAALGANVASTTATVTNNVSLTASFALIPYTVTVTQVAGGTVTVSPSQATYYYGNTATVAVTITNSSYGFASWNVTGGTVSPLTSSQATLTVQGNVTLSANIGTGATLTVTTARGTVVVTPSQATYPYGTTVTITTSTVNAGYVLDHWTLSGVGVLSNSGALTTTLTINGNSETVTAVYVTGSYVNNLNPSASDTNVGSLASPFKTIGKATGLAQAGSTIVVLQGVYREQPTLGNNGTSGSPITLRSNSGDRVVIDAANVIPSGSGSWTPCTAVTASGNPNYVNIYYTDINWNPVSLGEGNLPVVFEDETPLAWAKPTAGWWVVTGGSSTTLTDTVNLTQTDANYWVGSLVFLWDTGYTVQGQASITGYSPATHTLTVNNFNSISTNYATTGGDWYVIEGGLHALSGSGQMAVNPSLSGSYRVFVWPVGGGRPDGHLFEADSAGQNFWINLLNASYWVFSGLEVCNANANGIGGWNNGGHFTVQNCVIHHNGGNGIYLQSTYPGSQFLNNYITRNGTGITIGTLSPGPLVQGNEISWNAVHGINMCASSSSLVGNYIHDHMMWGHTDNIQIYNSNVSTISGLTNFLLQDNLVVNASQGIMMSEINGPITFRGNDFYCSYNYLIQSYPNDYNFDFEHNTILCAGYGEIPTSDFDVGAFHNNLFGAFGPYGYMPCSLAAFTATFTADYNLYWDALSGTTGTFLQLGANYTFAQYVTATGDDEHAVTADPKFSNMAKILLPANFGAYQDFAPNHFYSLNNIPAQVAVGDYLEIDGDGVARQITAINTSSNFVTFTPSDAKFAFKYGTALDWQANSNFAIDLMLQAGSPAIGAASDRGNIGSSINVPSYKANNFGAYGSRPAWPPPPANVTQWAVVASHSGGVGDLAVTASEGQVEPRSKAIKFQITFDSALSAATINSSAVSIVSSTGSNYSSRIASAALDATGRVLTVTLSSPLPDQQWYIIALNPAITAANGGPVRGVKSVKVGMLAGNVTGSRSVTAADAAAERNYIGVPVTAATARYDVDGNGVITAADQRLVQSLAGHSLP